MKFSELEVGDRFTVANGNEFLYTGFKEATCCTPPHNAIRGKGRNKIYKRFKANKEVTKIEGE